MGNSVTRAHTRRSRGLVEALDATLSHPGVSEAPTVDVAAQLEDDLAARGLCVTDIGGQQVDDDTAHRVNKPHHARHTG